MPVQGERIEVAGLIKRFGPVLASTGSASPSNPAG